MRGFPPNICCIECIRDNLNSTNTLKSQNSRIREGKKLIKEKKIPENSIGDRTTAEIRTKRHLYKEEDRKR